ncbi:hypothetical protein BCEP4_1730007 [Burkholderia cepacia]|nr:hypothetical protein BCEP4_1730007 [Burkholderia cepacia]
MESRGLVAAHAKLELVSVGAAQYNAFHGLDLQSVHHDGGSVFCCPLHEFVKRLFFELEDRDGAATFYLVSEIV